MDVNRFEPSRAPNSVMSLVSISPAVSHPAPFRDPKIPLTNFLFHERLNHTRAVGSFSSVLKIVE
jgi:hypothetical protein